ncbi:30S ribosome-binding factor RbfA [Clostridium sp.]|uniref:30S ribosome-binding factor RbfA n=1 Tax=Clostridium sp. TaxID=1506 RepID=UPI0026116C71
MTNFRGKRINEEVKKEVSDIIRNQIKDPRLTAMVSVTQVEVTKDLRYAKVFVSLFAKSDEEKEESLKALKSSAGFIRKEVGNRVKLRSTPEILFEEDNSIDNAMYIESLLNKIKEK